MRTQSLSYLSLTDIRALGLILFVALQFFFNPAHGQTIEFDPVTATVTEGDLAVLNVVTTSGSGVCDISYFTSGDTATEGIDYTGASGTVSVNGSAAILVNTTTDMLSEDSEDFFVELFDPGISGGSNPSCNLGSNFSATVTIEDPAPSPHTVVFSTNVVGIEGTSVRVDVEPISNTSNQACDVNVSTSPGTATPSTDFTPQNFILTFDAVGVLSSFFIPLANDSEFEGTEDFFVNLSPGGTGSLPSCNLTPAFTTATASIVDQTPAPILNFDPANISTVIEGGALSLDILTSGSTGSCEYDLFTSDGTATGTSTPPDYTPFNIRGLPIDGSGTIIVDTFTDAMIEGNETFTIELAPSSLNIDNSCAIGTNGSITIVIEEETVPTVEFAQSSITIDEGSTGFLDINSTGTNDCGYLITTVDGSAVSTSPDPDFTSTATGFAGNPTDSNFMVDALSDTLVEGPESYTVTITGQAGPVSPPCQIGAVDTATVNITDQTQIPHTVSIIGTNGDLLLEGDTYQIEIDVVTPGALACDIVFEAVADTASSPGDFTTTNTVLTFGTAPTSQIISIPLVADGFIEPTEFFDAVLSPSLTGNNPSCLLTPNSSFEALGIEDTPTVQFLSGGEIFSEGDTAQLQIDLVSGFSSCDVDVATNDITAMAPGDYSALTISSLNVPPSSAQISIPIATDSLIENQPETFEVTISPAASSSTPCLIGPIFDTVNVSITDNPTVQISPATTNITATEGESVVVEIAPTAASSPGFCDVDVATFDGTAIGGSDFDAQFTTLTVATTNIPTPTGLTVPITSDTLVEGNESFTVIITPSASGGENRPCAVATNDTATIIITDAAPPIAEFTGDIFASSAVYEGLDASFTIDLTSGSGVCDVLFFTTDDTATSPADFAAVSTVVTLGSGPQTITIPTILDNLRETSGNVFFGEIGPSNSSANPSCAIGEDSEQLGQISDRTVVFSPPNFTASTVTEGVPATVGVEFSFPGFGLPATCDVLVVTNDGTATAPDDYTAQSTLYTINSDGSTQVPINQLADSIQESPETFTMVLTRPTSGNTNPPCEVAGTHTITILDDSPPLTAEITAATTSVSVSEGESATIEIALSAGSSLGTCDIDITTLDGTAISGSGDYTAQSTTLTVQPSPNSQLSIPVLTDALIEDGEDFTVVLSSSSDTANPACAVGTNDTATVSIVDVPLPPVVEFTAATIATSVTEDSGPATLTLQISAGAGPATVDISTTNGSATAGSDYTAINTTLTIPAGTTAPVSIPITDDTTPFEDNETFTVTITPADDSNTLIGENSTATVTIVDSTTPPVVEFTAASTAFTLDEDGNSPVLEIVVSSGNTPASVELTTINGSATAPGDYTAVTETLTFSGATTSQTVTIPINTDALVEPDETLTVVLTAMSGSGTLIGDNDTSTITIVDTTTPPTVEFAASSTAITTDENGVSPTLTLNLTAGTAPASVDVTTVNGSATAPDDFVAITQTIVFPAGSTSQQLPLSILSDDLLETDESFTVVISPTAGSTTLVGQNSVATITITDTTLPPTIEFAASSTAVTVEENATSPTLTLNLVAGSAPASVDVVTVNGSAAAPGDFAAITQTIVFPAGSTTQTIETSILTDDVLEPAESFTVVISPTAGTPTVVGQNDVSTITITDTTAPPTVEFDPASVNVTANENGGSVSLDLILSNGSAPASVEVTTADGSAVAGQDYNGVSQTVEFPAGSTTQSINIQLLADNVIEANESFSVNLGTVDGTATQIGGAEQATVTITDTSLTPASVQMAANVVNVAENVGLIQIEVQREGNAPISVDVNTIDGTATSPADYEPTSATLSWAANESGSMFVTIPIIDDGTVDPGESFSVILSQADGGEIGATSSTQINIDDDSMVGVLVFTSANISTTENTESVTVQVERLGGTDGSVTVNFATENGSANSGSDFVDSSGVLTWQSGENGSKDITVTLLNDNVLEGAENFFIQLSGASPLGDDQQLGEPNRISITIADDSADAGQLQFVDASTESVSESESMVTVLVERVNGSEGNVLVEYATRDGSATNGEDYQAQTGRLSWESGELGSKPITITLLNDDLLEDTESFFIDLVDAFPISSVTQIGDPATHAISITDDDFTENTESPFRVAATSSTTRTHVEGQIAEDLDFEITDMRNGGALAPQLQVRWRAEPQGAVEFLQGDARDGFVFTNTDQNGRTSNSVRIVRSDGVVRVIAEAMLTSNPNIATDAVILSRNDIPDFSVPVGQGFYTIRIGIGEVSTLNRNQDSTGDGLDAACDTLRLLGGADGNTNADGADTTATQDLIATCEELEQQIENSQDPGTDLDRIAPEELFAITDSLIATADLKVTNVYSRINSIRSGNIDRLDVSGLQLTLLGETIPGNVINAAQNALSELSGGGAAAEDIFPERLGIFATGSISIGEIDGGLDDGSGEQQNADIETSSLSIGADYRLTDSLVLGGSLNFSKNDTQFTSAAGGSEVENFSLTVFGTLYKSDVGYADLVLDVGQSSFDIERQINLISDDDNPVMAMGKTNAQVASLTLGAGRNFNFAGWEVGPYGRLSITNANVDGYSERANQLTEGFGSVLNVRAHSATSTTISLGGQVSKAINTTRAVFVPQARFEFEAEAEGSKDGITASFQADPSNSLFTITGNQRDTSYFNLGIGASAQFTNGRSAQLFYETRAQQDNVAQHWLKFGFRLQF